MGDSRLPAALMEMTSEGQMRSHCRHPMQASSPSSSWSRAKLARYRSARGRMTSGNSTVTGLRKTLPKLVASARAAEAK